MQTPDALPVPANRQLLLSSVRQVLVRLEETILFALIERAQFRCNEVVYRRGAFPMLDREESLMGHLLHATERVHAAMRRYTSPDEQAFFDDLPTPRLPPLAYGENPLRPNAVNRNGEVRRIYETAIVPAVCAAGDDEQYGSSGVCDVACLQAISKRVHYGKFVAESKWQQDHSRLQELVLAGDRAGLLLALSHPGVEQCVLDRVRRKAATYVAELRDQGAGGVPEPDVVVAIYRDWIIPMNKEVQVEYLCATADGR